MRREATLPPVKGLLLAHASTYYTRPSLWGMPVFDWLSATMPLSKKEIQRHYPDEEAVFHGLMERCLKREDTELFKGLLRQTRAVSPQTRLLGLLQYIEVHLLTPGWRGVWLAGSFSEHPRSALGLTHYWHCWRTIFEECARWYHSAKAAPVIAEQALGLVIGAMWVTHAWPENNHTGEWLIRALWALFVIPLTPLPLNMTPCNQAFYNDPEEKASAGGGTPLSSMARKHTVY